MCFAKRAIEQVAFVPGTPFYCAQPDHATLRLSFATVGVDKIREGVGRLAQASEARARWDRQAQRAGGAAGGTGRLLLK